MWRTPRRVLAKTGHVVERSVLQQQHRCGSTSTGGSAAKAILWTTGVAAAGAGGTVGYAWYDPEFRKKIEGTVPQSKEMFQKVLGEARDASKPMIEMQSVKQLADKISSALPAKKEPKETGSQIAAAPDSTQKPQQPPSKPVQKGAAPGERVSGEDEDSRKETELHQRWKERDEELDRAGKKLEQRLHPLISRVEEAVKSAIDAKLKAAMLTEQHTRRVREAVELSKPEEEGSAWRTANDAYESMKQALKIAASSDSEARAQMEKLRKAINEGISSKDTGDHPVLTQASQTLNDWNYQLDEVTSRVKQAQIEQKITSDFKKLIMEGREQFAKELKSILPNVDIHAKGKKLSEDELNALIAHAHVRVDQLRRQLAEQQLREQQHIEQARQRQRAEDARFAEEKVDRALASWRSEQEVQTRLKLQEAKAEFEEELRKQMKRQAAAHSEHLEDVLKTQKDHLETQRKRDLNEALIKERGFFNREISTSIARLQAIEDALEGRAEQDTESRRSKQLWLACQHLKKAVLYGRAEGRDYASRKKPLAKEISSVKEAGVADPFVKTLVASVKPQAVSEGVFTQEDLIDRFQRVKKTCRRTALIGDSGGSLFQYFLSYIQSLFLFERVKPSAKEVQEIDQANIDTLGILWRASYFIDQFDFESAIKLLLLLKGEPARVASDWIKDARLHLETRRTAELLLAHASAVSIRTIY